MNAKGRAKNSELLIESFRDEILRWNKQINLVSRQETGGRLDGLFGQCIGGFEPVWNKLTRQGDRAVSRIYYFDLGSGGGLPGVLWHILFSEKTTVTPEITRPVQTWLVEPREKRAWFLNRLNRIPQMPTFGVLRGRWGEVSFLDGVFSSPGLASSAVVISLKALHLDDSEVLGGLRGAFSANSSSVDVLIVRYYPPAQKFDQDLLDLLKIPTEGSFREIDGFVYRALGGSVVPLMGPGEGLASLVLSSYEISARV